MQNKIATDNVLSDGMKFAFFFDFILFLTRELYHLKAIEFACKFIKHNCPYVNHLINSYHKHYN